MPCCVAVNCTNRTEKGVRVFAFPVDDIRRQQWIRNLRRESWTPTKYSRLCEKHFEESQFEIDRADNWRKLKSNAIPTLFDIPDPPAMNKNETDEPNTNATAEKDVDQVYRKVLVWRLVLIFANYLQSQTVILQNVNEIKKLLIR
nr:PREDICTED: THAP domain-containing protein 4-like [Linepithema humile]